MPFPRHKHFRKKANWTIALVTEAVAPALRVFARAKTGPPTPPPAWRKALIIGACHLGDLLWQSASLERLKAGLPHCDLYYLTAAGASEILQDNPALAGILPWLRSDFSLDLSPEHLARLRAMEFDAALCYNTGKYWPELLLSLRLRIPNRAGYVHKGFSALVTHPVALEYPKPFPAYFRNFVAALTGQAADWPLRPVIYPDAESELEAAALWERLGLSARGPVMACFMTTRQPTGVWPARSFGKALALIRQKTAAHIVLSGAAGDRQALAAVDQEFALEADLVTGMPGLRALGAFLRRCRLVLTTDSGPRHLANAVGLPVYFFRNLFSDPVETGVYLDTETDLCPPAGGLPAQRHAAVLEAITPEHVAEIIARDARLAP